jgi:hypothetical protein
MHTHLKKTLQTNFRVGKEDVCGGDGTMIAEAASHMPFECNSSVGQLQDLVMVKIGTKVGGRNAI